MSDMSKSKIIREYPLPCGPEVISCNFTGEWQILKVEAKFARPMLYVLEDVEGERSRVKLAIVPTNIPFEPHLVSGENTLIGSYLVHVPSNMLHVFGPVKSRAQLAAAV